MSETLQPYAEFDAQQLGRRLHELVSASKQQLAARNLLGLIARYGNDPDTAVEKVQKGQDELDPQHFAVIDDRGDVRGSASIYKHLRLGRVNMPLATGLARRIPFAYTNYPHATDNVHAWTVQDIDGDLLYDAYDGLLATFCSKNLFTNNMWLYGHQPWTVEPIESPPYVHEAITNAGLDFVQSARFDDGENGKKTPPISALYAHVLGDDQSPHTMHRELKNGSLLQLKLPWPDYPNTNRHGMDFI